MNVSAGASWTSFGEKSKSSLPDSSKLNVAFSIVMIGSLLTLTAQSALSRALVV